ncbi:hypothetical protein D6C87_01509 [Aureobasidium pullulans]|nr:hypothetical protein D6C87_01509 [Aureobasidium pullulans]
MPRYEEWKAANTGGKIKIARDNIQDKAQIAACHYVTRFTVFMENAITPKSRVVDYFDRQPELDLNNLALLAQQWGINVSADNLKTPPDEQPPMLLCHEQQGPDFSNLAQLLQVPSFRSAAIPTAFVRTRELELSVAAPIFLTILEIRDQPVVIKNPRRSAGHRMFFIKCNDPHLNRYNRASRYNRTMSLGWLANTDITPGTSLQALLNYLSEYCTKAGVKLMNKLIAKRDYSGHKIAHMLFSHLLVNILRTVIPVDCKFALQ